LRNNLARSRFEQDDASAFLRKGTGGGQTGEAAADDCDIDFTFDTIRRCAGKARGGVEPIGSQFHDI